MALDMTRAPAALQIENLVKAYGDLQVLHDISLTLEPGGFLVLVGPSGCGKSTLLNCIAGLEETSSGHISIAGRAVTKLAPRDRDIAMVFQSYALYPTMSVAENIAFGLKIRRLPKAAIQAKVEAVAALLQITPLLDRRPGQLSGGQRQRVAMGRALVRDPALFLFDEPLSNLDAKLRVDMRAEIKRLHQRTQGSIVYVTHDQIEAMTLATKIVVMKDGRVQQIGTPDEIYNAPANTFVADFMGLPPMNLLPVTVDGTRLVFGPDAALNLPTLPPALKGRHEVILGIRAEAFRPGTMLQVKPEMIEPTGADLFIRFTLGGASATARLPGRFAPPEGGILGLDVDLTTLCYFDAATGQRLG